MTQNTRAFDPAHNFASEQDFANKQDFVSEAEKRFLKAAPLPLIRRDTGRITRISGRIIAVQGLNHIIGQSDLILVEDSSGRSIRGQVIVLEGTQAQAAMFSSTQSLRVGASVRPVTDRPPTPCVNWIGKVLDHDGHILSEVPIQNPRIHLPEIRATSPIVDLNKSPPPSAKRKAIGPRLHTKVAAIDTFLPLCRGQRLGLFAGSGVGKSTLLGQLAKASSADINIIALIGERGREVRHFVEEILGIDGMEKSIIFVATSDMAPALKLRTAKMAMATAEYFRDVGQHVLFLCDSLTRYAEAHRDVALGAGEVPSLRAYPPSTFQALARLCERAGPGMDTTDRTSIPNGDITAIFNVLVAGSNMEEPVADMVRGILDGHIVLNREIAERGRFPAIDIRQSVSRSLPKAATDEQNTILQTARRRITSYEESKTLILAGMYVEGADPELDKAVKAYPKIEAFIAENYDASMVTIEDNFKRLSAILHPNGDGEMNEDEESTAAD